MSREKPREDKASAGGRQEGGLYQTELRSMMYACGDVRAPSPASSMYLEQIVNAQAKALLSKAHEISRLRGSRSVAIEDIVFVLRKDAYKVKKLSNYIFFRDVRRKAKNEAVPIKTSEVDPLRYDWLPPINQSEASAEMTNRLKYIDTITGEMTREEYLDFTECRQASFTFRKSKKFRDFLSLDYRIREDVVDVVGFVSYEMVFEITSLASSIRMQKSRKKSKTSLKIQGIFRTQVRKSPITEKDIDEACRRIIERRGTLY
jgi:transcription initiation protein SPT3